LSMCRRLLVLCKDPGAHAHFLGAHAHLLNGYVDQ
jgi:hypothetical protein